VLASYASNVKVCLIIVFVGTACYPTRLGDARSSKEQRRDGRCPTAAARSVSPVAIGTLPWR